MALRRGAEAPPSSFTPLGDYQYEFQYHL